MEDVPPKKAKIPPRARSKQLVVGSGERGVLEVWQLIRLDIAAAQGCSLSCERA